MLLSVLFYETHKFKNMNILVSIYELFNSEITTSQIQHNKKGIDMEKILGFTAGNFDLLHPGYINCFKDAKQYCDKFIVFLQRDPSLHRKSKYKPVIPLYDRYKALMSIKYIDEVYTYQTEEELYNFTNLG